MPTPHARPRPIRCAPGRRLRLPLLIGLIGCAEAAPPGDSAGDAGADPPSAAEAAAAVPPARVTIVEPADGTELDGPDVRVRFAVEGLRIAPAGDTTAGTGHHHVYLDHDLGEPGAPVPAIPHEIVHLGTGADEVVLEGVAPGEHRLIAVVADGMHVPLQPWVVDTVRFTVR